MSISHSFEAPVQATYALESGPSISNRCKRRSWQICAPALHSRPLCQKNTLLVAKARCLSLGSLPPRQRNRGFILSQCPNRSSVIIPYDDVLNLPAPLLPRPTYDACRFSCQAQAGGHARTAFTQSATCKHLAPPPPIPAAFAAIVQPT